MSTKLPAGFLQWRASVEVDKAMKAIAKDTLEKAAFRAFRLVVNIQNRAITRSRVDTGWYRANWRVSSTLPAGTQANPGGGSFTAPAAPAASLLNAIINGLKTQGRASVYVHNNVTYAAFLEARYATLARAAIDAARAVK